MYTYFCKNCKNIIYKWNDNIKNYDSYIYCNRIISKNYSSINFLDCKKCNKFVGIVCFPICKNCFEEDEIFEEKNIWNWFQNYKKILNKYPDFNYICNKCNKINDRKQHWFFKELTFYKQ